MHRYIIIVFCILFTNELSAQYTVSPSPVKWYDLDQAFELKKKAARPILIVVYTDRCSWCNFMMKTTFTNKGIADYLNENFYPVRFNAESMDTIEFQGKKYFNRKIGRRPTHDFVSILLEGKLSYPSIVYFNLNGEKMVVPGYMEPKDIEPILVYQVENLSKCVSLLEFTANFMFTYPTEFEKDHSIFKIPTLIRPDTLGKPKWIKPEKINIQKKKKRKPTIVFFQSDGCISCEVMEKTTFGNKDISEQINENFNIVKIDAKSQSTISLFGKQYASTGHLQTHELAQSLLQNNSQFPAVVFFDETGKSLNKLNGYMNVQNLKPLIYFFSEKKYQDITYNEYLKKIKTSLVVPKTSMN